ncbi:ATP-dependent Clp protease proteolytic subunit 3 [Lathyrus oleraceus]|uniref:ATP-dependent Clp protease proteolytic subunit n=1 Tax=Pisum sativum TaxID=3888 RepID=A0A9D5AGQ1_PEA|nr:ATP-dependent Clp protease proteolytic subunit 3 [Pisum sativum]
MLLRQRIVFWGSRVDDMTADLVNSYLLFLDVDDPKKDVKLFINSHGGFVTGGVGIYDSMKLCKVDVSTICFGLVASMGTFLLATGTKGGDTLRMDCSCKGELALTHQDCAVKWFSIKGNKTCDMCKKDV